MKTSTVVVAALLVCALAGISMLGCNMFRGAGKDIQRGGRAVERAADNAQRRNAHPGPHLITTSAEAGGSISPSGRTSVSHRSSQAFSVKANRGYHVADVLVDGKSVGARSRYTFYDVTEDHIISAYFVPNPRRRGPR